MSGAAPLVFGASVLGDGHRKGGLPCQDSHAWAVLAGSTVVVAVADGLGAAAHSDVGSGVAARAAVDGLAQAWSAPADGLPAWEPLLRASVARAREALEECASSRGCDLRDLATTLIVAALWPGGAAVAHVGDGAVVAGTGSAPLLLSAPADSEYVNQVVPLTSSDWESHVRVACETRDLAGLCLFTDGCQLSLLDGAVPFEPFFGPLFAFAARGPDAEAASRQVAELLASEKLARVSEDDKTLVVAWLPPPHLCHSPVASLEPESNVEVSP